MLQLRQAFREPVGDELLLLLRSLLLRTGEAQLSAGGSAAGDAQSAFFITVQLRAGPQRVQARCGQQGRLAQRLQRGSPPGSCPLCCASGPPPAARCGDAPSPAVRRQRFAISVRVEKQAAACLNAHRSRLEGACGGRSNAYQGLQLLTRWLLRAGHLFRCGCQPRPAGACWASHRPPAALGCTMT